MDVGSQKTWRNEGLKILFYVSSRQYFHSFFSWNQRLMGVTGKFSSVVKWLAQNLSKHSACRVYEAFN